MFRLVLFVLFCGSVVCKIDQLKTINIIKHSKDSSIFDKLVQSKNLEASSILRPERFRRQIFAGGLSGAFAGYNGSPVANNYLQWKRPSSTRSRHLAIRDVRSYLQTRTRRPSFSESDFDDQKPRRFKRQIFAGGLSGAFAGYNGSPVANNYIQWKRSSSTGPRHRVNRDVRNYLQTRSRRPSFTGSDLGDQQSRRFKRQMYGGGFGGAIAGYGGSPITNNYGGWANPNSQKLLNPNSKPVRKPKVQNSFRDFDLMQASNLIF